ncbi:conserved carboxylase domain protein, partial [Vibrio parahaemolyticus V-223/04]
STVPLLRQ